MKSFEHPAVRAIIGLGNPGKQYALTRHNIGFRVVDAVAEMLGASWRVSANMAIAEGQYHERPLVLIKPLTGMNNSGVVVPELKKRNIPTEAWLVAHDELELPFGKIAFKMGGSARGHNGLRSIIAARDDQFQRLRIGIGRPAQKEDVPDYVLSTFSEGNARVEDLISEVLKDLEKYL